MNLPAHALALPDRSGSIAHARRAWLHGEVQARADAALPPWIARSWQRCLAAGRSPRERVMFEAVPRTAAAAAQERCGSFLGAARPVLERLSRAIAGTHYFALLTDADGVVIEVGALHGQDDRAMRDIARVGVDLSERAVGTTAIGAALAERSPVWLHRGEHFFEDTGVYTCAGAPVFDPAGRCVGMLDLTGVNVVERPELQHLAQHAAQAIQNAWLRSLPCALLLQVNWPGSLAPLDAAADSDGLLCLDADGRVLGANAMARQLLPLPAPGRAEAVQAGDLFAVPPSLLFDAAARHPAPVEVPLWSGLRLHVRAQRRDVQAAPRLRDVQASLIRQAVQDARGNVAEAARALGVSRATIYRRLAAGQHRR
ncbi:helix-turn-helix domain-containing protein [Xenophilus azovorans]|uniref:helix-turn-helix domain-containing protein n=1 Tax=Xenophilus TaxID=151754 RepID=UPI000571EEED|nr:helix-turn-helix domain-containing protein [Xenophilus azovorans]